MIQISVITPSFNQGRFIERTIQSVLAQNIEGLEYLIVDGGSSDNTSEIVKEYQDRLILISEPDHGQTDAVNKGINATSGPIIGWLNSDDIYYPGALSIVRDYFAAHPEKDVLYGCAHHIDENDQIIEPYYTEEWSYERLREVCFLCQPAVFFRRNVVKKAGLLDTHLSFCMDYEYWLRLGKIAEFGYIHHTLAGSRMYKGNKTMSSRIAIHKEINNMFRQRLKDVPEKWIFAYAHEVVKSKGFRRDTIGQNLRFVSALSFVTVVSFLRWKRRLPVRSAKTVVNRTLSSFRNLARKLVLQLRLR
jgi:glycosyltransferase involved in cell wall biosynthesis